jgi:hypothetical protein
MTTFTSSRMGVLGRLVAFPFIVAAFAARAAAAEFRNEFGALKTDFVPAVRYVLTGDPETSVAGVAGSKVSSLRDRIRHVFATYAQDRLIALALLLLMPFFAAFWLFIVLRDEDFFRGIYAAVVDCLRAIVTGDKVIH